FDSGVGQGLDLLTVLTLCITLLYPRVSFRFEIQNKATRPSAGGRSYHRRQPNHHGRLSSVPEPNYKPEDTQKQSSLRLKTKLRVDKIPLPTKPPLLQSTRIEKALTPPPQLPRETTFHQRVDRHGRPFGDRAATYQSRAPPLGNKITPNVDTEGPRNMRTERSPHAETKSPRSLHSKERAADEHRLPLERNLDKEDFPPLQFAQVPPTRTTKEVMEELREVTYQYTNCADPVESAARKQRLLDGEVHGLMEQTAATTVAREQEAQQAYITTRVAEIEVENEMETEKVLPYLLCYHSRRKTAKGKEDPQRLSNERFV
ncbi:unnamed protein product, partial [Brassica oleracea]